MNTRTDTDPHTELARQALSEPADVPVEILRVVYTPAGAAWIGCPGETSIITLAALMSEPDGSGQSIGIGELLQTCAEIVSHNPDTGRFPEDTAPVAGAVAVYGALALDEDDNREVERRLAVGGSVDIGAHPAAREVGVAVLYLEDAGALRCFIADGDDFGEANDNDDPTTDTDQFAMATGHALLLPGLRRLLRVWRLRATGGRN